jgi:hypothetical protein
MEDYLTQAMTYRTSPNGVFGIKIHYQALETDFIKAGRDPASLFPGLRYILITEALAFAGRNEPRMGQLSFANWR